MTTCKRERGSSTAAALGVVAALIGLVTAILGLVPALRPWQGDAASTSTSPRADVNLPTAPPGDLRTPASVYLSKESGPGGASVKVSGENYAAQERVEIRFGGEVVGRPTTNGQGKFSNVAVEVPTSLSAFAPFQVDVVATGKTSIKWATAPFKVTG